jgi:hypothetical protein
MEAADKGIRRPAAPKPLAAVAAAVAIAAALVPAAAHAGAPERPAPPTSAQVQERTRDFLGSGPAAAPRAAAPRDGGIGSDGDPIGKGAGVLFGDDLYVALYGAPQLTGTAVGKRSPMGAARKVKQQAKAYKKHTDRRVRRSIDLIGVIATATPGPDRLYRTRQSATVIKSYLKAARSIKARLVLDIQPGRSSALREMRALKPWLRRPEVDVAIDPEWNVGRKGVPGKTEGSIRARELNRATRWLDDFVAARDLPEKALIVHQFRERSIRGRGKLVQGDKVDVLLNFDGIGTAKAKKAGYENLAVPGIFDGFSLFYDLDVRMMRPPAVIALRPEVDFAMYQ